MTGKKKASRNNQSTKGTKMKRRSLLEELARKAMHSVGGKFRLLGQHLGWKTWQRLAAAVTTECSR
eukprot:CAMPEP_0206498194 /NCGR_PEP_ID=MMETSP0324_2-20121206/50793_1 /ASSEMBLY_ACC=CAM_ASM_000836 /TAXON_ID=2866 /ORGANISM="Crypthecodinium cohnii, Strain Seligo" /LENGTH=65 /DNA_ID=CAMNT_0053984223 /DNA_START=247 /DNA_END=440 /DNA_ORIENTATION=-